LQSAADAAIAYEIPRHGREPMEIEPGELEGLLAAVRAAIAAPVLALHRPCHPIGQGDKCPIGHAEVADLPPICSCCKMWPSSYTLYPCATVRALGVAA
jgi:hypothetical protein